MKERFVRFSDRKGFSLIEIMVSIVIFLMVSQTVFLSIAFSGRMNRYANRLRQASGEIGKQILEEAGREEGEVRLEFGEYSICADGYLYVSEVTDGYRIRAIWVDVQDGGERLDIFGEKSTNVTTDSNAEFYETEEGALKNDGSAGIYPD